MSVVEPGGQDAPEIPNGLYRATITAIEDQHVDTDQFGNFEKIVLHLEFSDDELNYQLDPRVSGNAG